MDISRIKDLTPDVFTVMLHRPNEMTHQQAAEKMRSALFSWVDQFENIKVK